LALKNGCSSLIFVFLGVVMLTIRTNTAATQAKKDYNASSKEMASSFGHLSSGYRITKASDDSAGLSVGTNLTAQIQSLKQTIRNAMDGLSALQTVEASLAAGQELLSRLRQLTMQSISDGVGAGQRDMIQSEMGEVLAELGRISEVTEFNGMRLLDGSVSSLDFQIGIRGGEDDYITLEPKNVGLTSLGLDGFSGASSQALQQIDDALEKISDLRAEFGAAQNRLTSVVTTIGSNLDSLNAGRSRVMDTDVAKEVANISNQQVVQQAGASVIRNSYAFTQTALRILEK
jgi:flagellin